ncbi:hypothetical protein MNBD_GAMMA06-1027 [hydrothermal vent metagenome]|uniref:Uncharacterized protein n=1 Tax=hydrothermal vent metagenome TaxID=652676 RepID=A0A3B0WRM4_9ZZZZ
MPLTYSSGLQKAKLKIDLSQLMEISLSTYHNNYSVGATRFVNMHHEDEIILANAALDATTDNYEEFDQKIDPAKLGDKLIQKNTLKGSARKFQYYANNHLLLSRIKSKKAKIEEFRVDVAWLSSEPVHSKVVAWKWLSGALASAALAAMFIFFSMNETIDLKYSIIVSTISLTAALIFLLIFIYQIRNEYIFKSHFGGAELFLIENNQPNQEKFKHFFLNLQKRIEKAKAKISVSDRLLGELKMCRRLKDEGIINDKTYTVARTAIFKHEQYKT